jgi:hypothetical protein
MVTVYSYKYWDEDAGRHRPTRMKATVDALVRMSGCTPVQGSGENVAIGTLTADGLYDPDAVLAVADSGVIATGRGLADASKAEPERQVRGPLRQARLRLRRPAR